MRACVLGSGHRHSRVWISNPNNQKSDADTNNGSKGTDVGTVLLKMGIRDPHICTPNQLDVLL